MNSRIDDTTNSQETARLNAEIARLNGRVNALESQLKQQSVVALERDLIWQNLDLILQDLPVGIAILEGPEFRYLKINQYLAKLHNLSAAKHIGQPLAVVFPHLIASVIPTLTSVLTTGKGSELREFDITLADGSIRYLIDFNFPISKNTIVSVVMDVSKQKLTEMALSKSNKALDEKIQTLKDTQHQLVQTAKLVSMGQLTAGLTHELNQPLGRIFLTAELAQAKLKRLDGGDPQPILNYMQRIMEDVKSSTTLINHLKTYSRQDVESVIIPMNIEQLTNEAISLFQSRIDTLQIDFKQQLMSDDLPLQGDPEQIGQVINNLISNAIDALKEAQTNDNHQASHLTLKTYDEGKFTCIKVKDNGCGMNEMTLSCIFDPFFTTKPSGQGTGLGLSISRGIIESHRGKLTAQSEEGKGSCFTIWLPK